MKTFAVVAVLVLSIVTGALLITTTSEEEFVLVQPKVAERVPAALNDTRKLRQLEESIVKVTHKDKLWEKTLIASLEGTATVQLPQVALLDPSGRDNLACLIYGQVTLTFVAEGMATSGEKPTLEMSAPCEFDLTRPEVQEVLLVPFSEILQQPARDGELVLQSHPGYTFRVAQIQGEWPVVWVLQRVSYQHIDGTAVNLEAPHLSASQDPLPTMIW